MTLILSDIETSYKEQKTGRWPQEVVSELAQNKFKNDAKTTKILLKHFGDDWKNKCEIALALSKQLGNIYTGSLYLGLLSLICNQTLDLTDKRVLMFSYGSGYAASMFVLRFKPGYKNIQRAAYYEDRLNSRVRVSPEDFDAEMTRREKHFGLADQKLDGSIGHILEGSYYLTNIDK